MCEIIEKLPPEIIGHDGRINYFRIKQRNTDKSGRKIKRWVIRYIRPRIKGDESLPKLLRKTYRVELQAWGNTLESAARQMRRKLELYYSPLPPPSSHGIKRD